MSDKEEKEINEDDNSRKDDYVIDFTTSSAISRVNIKFLAVYLPIFWCSGLLVAIMWYDYFRDVNNWVLVTLLLPIQFVFSYFIILRFFCFFPSIKTDKIIKCIYYYNKNVTVKYNCNIYDKWLRMKKKN